MADTAQQKGVSNAGAIIPVTMCLFISFQDGALVDEIYGCPIMNGSDMTWN